MAGSPPCPPAKRRKENTYLYHVDHHKAKEQEGKCGEAKLAKDLRMPGRSGKPPQLTQAMPCSYLGALKKTAAKLHKDNQLLSQEGLGIAGWVGQLLAKGQLRTFTSRISADDGELEACCGTSQVLVSWPHEDRGKSGSTSPPALWTTPRSPPAFSLRRTRHGAWRT
jgi:hypothetical protein